MITKQLQDNSKKQFLFANIINFPVQKLKAPREDDIREGFSVPHDN